MANISVKYGDELSVYYYYPENIKPNVSLESGKLAMDFYGSPEISTKADNYKLIIVLPEATALTEAAINTDVGNVDINGISLDSLTVEADCGNVTLKDMEVKNLEADLDLGNLTITDSTIDTSDVSVDMGNYEAKGSYEAVSADVSMGNIILESDVATDDMDLNLDVSMGNCKVNGKNYL